MPALDFGLSIPTRGPLATPAGMLALARRAEALGFAYLAIPDHIVIPRSIASPYPYNTARKMLGADRGDTFEPVALMAYLAAVTTRIRLLTSVMVVPHRPAVLTAKMLATIDVLSGGRVTVGCGAGWMAEEFAAIGAPPFSERGKVTDEYLAAFKALWTEEDPRFDGAYVRFADVSFLPKPEQKPHPPLWIGGESPAALRRAARFGNAWYPIGSNPDFPLDTLERYRASTERLAAACEKVGRDPKTLELAYWVNWSHEQAPRVLEDGSRQLFTGGAAAALDDLQGLAALGLRHCLFNLQRATLAESIDAAERFAGEVMAKLV